MTSAKNLAAMASAIALSACSMYQKDNQLKTVQDDVRSRTSYTLERFGELPPAAPLSGTLTYDQVIKTALQHNPSLQAYMEDLNIASADELQAGLLINPTFQGEFVFNGNGMRPLLDFMLALDVGHILTRNQRVKAAVNERKNMQANVTRAIITTITSAQSNLLRLWRAEAMLRLYNEQLIIAEAGAKTVQLLHDAGNVTDGMLAEYMGVLDITLVQKTQAQLLVLNAREALASSTGTPLSTNVSASTNIIDTSFDMNSDTFIKGAIEANLKLNGERQKLKALGARFKLAKISAWLEHLELEAVYEREEDGAGEGFSVTVPVPIFDWGQVRTGRAQAMLDATSYRYKAYYIYIRNRADVMHQYIVSLKAASARMTENYINNADNAYAFDQSQLNAMQIGPLMLLRARRELTQKQMQTIDIQYQFSMATLDANAMIAGITLSNTTTENMMSSNMTTKEGGH
ncbi:TolC family protein [Kordiimonas aquimaris]|uniref:TolC family protein n=1 Tax=Kordiimonas aquimaris TaxID=707591 RepID=UPI0021CF4594|nr:TolC family protein [Kordiimonas aquimaris]